MSVRQPAIDPAALAYARGLLKPPVERERVWPTLAAAAFAAICALAFAVAMVIAPPVVKEPLPTDTLAAEAGPVDPAKPL
ncbi:hypothetical protein [Caulobacter sp. NIBR2454]|uniref:hypothetical protein n=1 Tax=Caulobacter sp. NIBR2454 TaxID=3015996 RepID=UPI0022B64038|nr:hypothetical protein [Caulobacter sp. NIBR2454]